MTSHPEAFGAPGDFAAISVAGAATFTRDGRTLHYLRGSGLSQIWALEIETGTHRQLTFHDEKVAMIRRSPVDDRFVYGIDRGGDERQQLMLLDPEGGVRPLTDNPAVIHDWGGWSPDGASIAYAANERDEAHFDVYVQDVEAGTRRCVFHGTGIVIVSGFRSDGARLALLQDRGYGDMLLMILDLREEQAEIFPQPSGANYQSVRWARDGRTLLALTDHGGASHMRLCRLDPDSGAVDPVHEAAGWDIEAWAISPDGETLATVENNCGWSVLRIGATGGNRPVVEGPPAGVISDPGFSPDGAALVFTVTAPTAPGALWLWRDGAAHPLWQPALWQPAPGQPAPGESTAGESVAGEPVAEARFVGFELVGWESFDGTRIPGWLALPDGPVPPDGHKAVIWVHGGPIGQARPNFRPDIQMLLAAGFAVLMPNVRGSSGYGRAYAESDDVEKRLDSVTDLAYGRHWLAAHPAINSSRIGIMGQSYGGYMVNAAITEHPDLWKAAVSYYSIVDFTTTLAGTGPWRRSHRAAEYGDPERHADLFARISPIHHVDRIQVPVLLAHGARDPRVPIGESEQFEVALRERQKRVTYLMFDYAGHGFIRPDDKRRVYAAVADFFAQHV